MRKAIVSTFLVLTFLCSLANAEIITVTQTIKQTFGGNQSADDARISAIAKAKREAVEKAGVYVEALTVVKESKVDKDEILALTAGVVKVEVVSQKNYASEDAFGIEIIVNVVVDTSVLEERVKKLLQDKTHLAQLKDTQKREKELLQRVAQLEEENRKLTAEKQSSEKLKKEFQQASDGLTAVDWLHKAAALWDKGKHTDPIKAIEYLNNAIKLQPDDPLAYGFRGIAYDELGQYQRAIEDYNEVIRLKPDFSEVIYYLRGDVYTILGNYNQAIKDYNKAIELNPQHADVYVSRGVAYGKIGNYKQAIKDLNRAIELTPKYAVAYYDRAIYYGKSGNDERAIQDLKVAARLGHQGAQDLFKKAGIDWTLEGVPRVTSYDRPPEKPETNPESSSSVTGPDKTQQKPVKNAEPSTDADDPYKRIKAIVLKNGNVIEGKILSWNPDIVMIRTKDGKVSSYDFKNDVQTFITE